MGLSTTGRLKQFDGTPHDCFVRTVGFRQQLIVRPRERSRRRFRKACQAAAVFAQHAGGVLRRATEQSVVERGEIVARHRHDDDAGEASVRGLPPSAGGEIGLVIAAFEAALDLAKHLGLSKILPDAARASALPVEIELTPAGHGRWAEV